MTRIIAVTLFLLSGISAAADSVSFRNDVLPLLARQGCSTASCHGSPRGKGDLRLSLWGLDVESDYKHLTDESPRRRTNPSDPAASLVLAKPSRRLPHKGGLKLPQDGVAYKLLEKWIAAGCPRDDDASACVKIVVCDGLPRPSNSGGSDGLGRPSYSEPASPLRLHLADPSATLKVTAEFTDGSRRDVSHLAVFSTTNESIATVTVGGVVSPWSRGLAAINVRYQQQLETVFVTVTDSRPDFAWSAPAPANYVDELTYAQLRELQILPAKPSSDEEFLRRVQLDVVGVLPEPDRVRAFLADESPDKRAKLIDELLQRDDHAKFWAQRWGDLLQIRSQWMGQSSLAYGKWLEQAWASNLPYDQFVTQLVTATGPAAQEPKANFYRLGTDHFETMEAAAVVLLGARIQCAKCHNHPQERWSQADYHGLRHFFHRVSVTGEKDKAEIRLAADAPVKLPDSDKAVGAWLPGVGAVRLNPDEDPRVHLARWLGEKDNPYLARVEANRIWSFLLGRGIVEPYDDLRDTNPPLNPPLLAALARDFAEHGFDRRHILRTILRSNTYQTSRHAHVATVARPWPPSQVATVARPWPASGDGSYVKPFLAQHCVSCHNSRDPAGGVNVDSLSSDFSRPADATAWTKILRQLTHGLMPPESEPQPTSAARRQIATWIRAGLERQGHSPREETYFATYTPRRLAAEQILDAISHVTGTLDKTSRATHLPVPDREQHEFLQTFGQPQRSSTCSCERPTDASLGEGLALFNGKHVQEKLKSGSSRFRRAIRDKKSDSTIIEDLFLAAYCRHPTPDESSAAEKYIQSRPNRELAYEDLCWALMTTNEFLMQH